MKRREILGFLIIIGMALVIAAGAAAEASTDTALQRGEAALEAELYEEALAIYDAAIAEEPDVAAYHGGRGNALVCLDRFEEGIDELSVAMRLDPKNWEYPAERAVAYFWLGQLDKALVDSQKAVDKKPDDPVVYTNHAYYQIELRMFDEAVDTCASTIEKYPNDPEVYRLLGIAYYCLRYNDYAYTAYMTAIAYGSDLQPEFYPGYNDLAEEFPGMFIDATVQWSYELEDGNATILGCVGKRPSGQLTIPGEVDGYPVTGIGFMAFYQYRLTGVTIPDSVTFIGEMAFEDCMLTAINIPGSVTDIEGNPFTGCPLTSFTVSPGSSAYSVTDGVLFDRRDNRLVSFPGARTGGYEVPQGTAIIGEYAFCNCELTSVTLPHSVTCVEWGAFAYCSGLTGTTIPDSVTDIHPYAFMDSDSVVLTVERDSYAMQYARDNGLQYTFDYTDVTGLWKYELEGDSATIVGYAGGEPFGDLAIPETVDGYPVTTIGYAAFYESSLTGVHIPDSITAIEISDPPPFSGCPLTAFSVSPGNPVYVATDGVLFDKRDNRLVSFPGARTGAYKVPQDTAIIGDYAFYQRGGPTEVILPESVSEIGDYAFLGCENLTSVTIPASVTGIGECAFDNENDKLLVTVAEGSYAEQYAIENDIAYTYGIDNNGAKKITYGVRKDGSVVIYNLEPVYIDGYEAHNSVAFAYILKDGLATIVGFSSYYSRLWDWMYQEWTESDIVGYSDSLESAKELYEPGLSAKEAEAVDDGNGGVIWVDENDPDKGFTLVIPNRIDGYPVVAIYDGAFEEAGFCGVTLPEGLISIGDGAFGACYELESIIIPDSVTSIGDYAFQLCYSLAGVAIPAGVTDIGECAFTDCEALTLFVQEGSYAQQYAEENGFDFTFEEMRIQPDALADLIIPEGWDTGMVLGAALTSEGMLLAVASEYWTDADGWLAFLDKEGEESWSFEEWDALFLHPTLLANGGFAVLCKRGFSEALDDESQLVSLMILSPQGVVIANPSVPRYARDIVAVGDSIFVLGNQEAEDGEGEPAIGESYLARFNSAGELLWAQNYTHPDYAELKFQKAVYAEESLIIGANADVAESGLGVCALYRCDLDGNFLWAAEATPEIGNKSSIIDLCVNDDGIIAMVCGEYVYAEEYGEPLDRMCDVFGRNMDGDALWNHKMNGAMIDYILPVQGGFLCVSQGLDLYNCPYIGDGWALLLDENGNVKATDSPPDIGGGRYEIYGMAKGVSGEAFLYGTLLDDPGAAGAPFIGRLDFPEAYD